MITTRLIFFLFILCVFIAPWGNAARAQAYPKSDHYDGKHFFNPGLKLDKSFWDIIRWRWQRRGIKDWPPWHGKIEPAHLPETIKDNEVFITFINHASTLVQFRNWNILTDPVFSNYVGPFSFLSVKRYHPPGLSFDQLPKIDSVIVSHSHYDHMDLPSLKELNRRFSPKFFVALGNAKYLESVGIPKDQIVEMDWWQEQPVNDKQKIISVPVQHWSARWLWDRNEVLWSGYVLQSGNKKVYFAGDTGYTKNFKEARDRLGAMDVALLPIGAYEPRWFMKPQHINPEDAVQAHLDLGARNSVAIHFGTFDQSDESVDQPIADLEIAKKKLGIDPAAFITLKPAETARF